MPHTGPGITENFFKESFQHLIDPRRTNKGNIVYSFEEILFLTVAAVISGCTAWTTIAEFGRIKCDWLRKFYKYETIPSHDAISDLFSALDPKSFSECFINWIMGIAKKSESDVVAIDGKTVRCAAKKGNKFGVHIVSAFCEKNRLCLGQLAVEEKGNELTAIPELLELLMIHGCVVTLDAMGCQKNIAALIIEKKADYILQVKNNQAILLEQLEDIFNSKEVRTMSEMISMGHGRIEKRKCEVITDLSNLEGAENWKNLYALVRIESHRTIKKTNEKSIEFRYYITSLVCDATRINNCIRSHWSIENNLHWCLDVIFNEDGQLKRKGYSEQNFNVICKAALALIENKKGIKDTKPLMKLKALLDDDYREFIMKV